MSVELEAPLRLFTEYGCPFSHRVLALFAHLDVEHEVVECPVGDRPLGLERHSKHGRVPLLVHGDIVLSESRVMLEHLSEHFDMAGAFPDRLRDRSRHRHAMAMVDGSLVPLLTAGLREHGGSRLDDALDALEDATSNTAPTPQLLALHVAPIWLRFRWWRPTGAVVQAVEARPALCRWLDLAVALECVRRSAPDKAMHLADVDRVRSAGLLAADASTPPSTSAEHLG